jgi:uncharacterized membrane protein YsdA (DUF1294 family)
MSLAARVLAAVLILFLALAATELARAPTWLLIAYLMLGTISIAVYWWDKAAAEAGRWRVPEVRLHGIDAIGGIAGGLVAQGLLRHKTRKPGFAAVTWLIVLVHVLALATLDNGLWSFPAPG